MDGVRTGGELPPPVEDDEQNDTVYKAYRDRPVAEIQAEARQSWDHLAAAIESCSEADLMRPHPYAPGRTLLDTVSDNGHGHLGQHLMFWYLESGDEAAAEKAQVWAHDLERATSPDAKRRAYASYNLACFYGRVGRVEPAVPLLRESFEDAPDLVEWAPRDTDLDRIREHPGVVALLQGGKPKA